MKNSIILFLYTILLLGFCVPKAFTQEPIGFVYDTAQSDSIIFESPLKVSLDARALVRFSSNARVYLNWKAPAVLCTGYSVKYKLAGASNWTTVSNSTQEIVLTGLQLDTNYLLQIIPTGTGDLSAYGLTEGGFTTNSQTEPIQVSFDLYNQLIGWFTGGRGDTTFCDFIDDNDINVNEKLSFLQKYAFDNEDFIDAGNSTDIIDFYPSRFDSLNTRTCLPRFLSNCRCMVISNGSNYAKPGERDYINVKIKPRVVQKIARAPHDKTYVDRFEAGAAKFVSLRQDEGAGEMSYEMSNMPSADDQNAITNEVSEIKFFLACVQRDEGGTTNLPEECDCNRPLYVSYEYTTNIHVSAQKGGCLIGSRGAGAQAEDMALVVAYNLKTGEVTALDANKFAIGRKCDTGWNVDWWLSLLDVTKSVMSYWVSTQGGTGAIPTQTQQDDFFDSLESLLSTSFSISTGSCGDIEDSRVLVSGDNTLSLIPNEPIRIALMSAYYVRTNGYGCYHSEAAVASDYFLLGVVESELTSDPECCADKFADYIVGSLSVPEEGDVEVNAINSIVGGGCFRTSSILWVLG